MYSPRKATQTTATEPNSTELCEGIELVFHSSSQLSIFNWESKGLGSKRMLKRRINTVLVILALNIWAILKGLDSNCNGSLKQCYVLKWTTFGKGSCDPERAHMLIPLLLLVGQSVHKTVPCFLGQRKVRMKNNLSRLKSLAVVVWSVFGVRIRFSKWALRRCWLKRSHAEGQA